MARRRGRSRRRTSSIPGSGSSNPANARRICRIPLRHQECREVQPRRRRESTAEDLGHEGPRRVDARSHHGRAARLLPASGRLHSRRSRRHSGRSKSTVRGLGARAMCRSGPMDPFKLDKWEHDVVRRTLQERRPLELRKNLCSRRSSTRSSRLPISVLAFERGEGDPAAGLGDGPRRRPALDSRTTRSSPSCSRKYVYPGIWMLVPSNGQEPFQNDEIGLEGPPGAEPRDRPQPARRTDEWPGDRGVLHGADRACSGSSMTRKSTPSRRSIRPLAHGAARRHAVRRRPELARDHDAHARRGGGSTTPT